MDVTKTTYEIIEKRWVNRPTHSGYVFVSRQEITTVGPERALALAALTVTDDTDAFVYERGSLVSIVEAGTRS